VRYTANSSARQILGPLDLVRADVDGMDDSSPIVSSPLLQLSPFFLILVSLPFPVVFECTFILTNTRKATSVVCPKDLGHYLPAIEASSAKLRLMRDLL
jgi:hypothetical protein